MKKYILYILTGVAACGLCSCEDALDRYPKDRLTPDNFFHTEEECQLYTNDFYTMFPSAGTIYGETADIIAKTTLTSEVLGNRTVPATAGSWKWEKLRDINFFLQYSSNCADEHVRLEYEGVARFFRAWFYFEKVKHYGDVPWVDRPIDAGDPLLFEKGRDPREMVMQKVIEDLDFAVTNLPVERSVYRVTRWAALALKSRVCLFEGTFRKYHGLKDWESYLTACATASKRFTDESGYSVYTTGTTPYLNLFSSLKALDTEIVLARAYNTAIGLKHDVNGYLTSITMGRPGLLKNIANMYLMKDGTPFTSQPGWETMQLPEESKNRDGRFAQTVRTPGYKRIDDTALSAPNLAATMTGYQLVKYLQSAKYDSYNASTNDLPLLRAAEVMLNYAEAKAELGTLTQEDIDLAIKPLRDRAGVANLSLTKANASPDPYLASPETGYANVTGDNKGVILEIRRERTVELLMENLRYWDIMRWKEGKRFEKPFTGLYFPGTGSYDLNNDGVNDVCIWSGSKPATSAPAVYELNKEIFLSGGDSGYIIIHTDYARSWNEERDYLYPVPTDDRVLTQGAITQNPGWNDGLNFYPEKKNDYENQAIHTARLLRLLPGVVRGGLLRAGGRQLRLRFRGHDLRRTRQSLRRTGLRPPAQLGAAGDLQHPPLRGMDPELRDRPRELQQHGQGHLADGPRRDRVAGTGQEHHVASDRPVAGTGRPHGDAALLLQDDQLPRRRLRHRHPLQDGA